RCEHRLAFVLAKKPLVAVLQSRFQRSEQDCWIPSQYASCCRIDYLQATLSLSSSHESHVCVRASGRRYLRIQARCSRTRCWVERIGSHRCGCPPRESL